MMTTIEHRAAHLPASDEGSGVCASFLKFACADAVHSKGFDVLLWP